MYEPKPVTHSRAMFHDLKTAVPSCTANSKEHAVAKAKPHARHRHVPAPHTAKPLLPVAEGQEVAVVRVARAARLENGFTEAGHLILKIYLLDETKVDLGDATLLQRRENGPPE